MKRDRFKIIFSVLRVFIGSLFVFSGIMKMTDLVLFQETIELFQVFPQYSKAFTIIIPAAELVVGAFLVLGIFRKGSLVVLISLLLSFIIAMWANLLEGFPIDCGCFGPLEIFSTVSVGKIIFNFGLIFTLVLIFLRDLEKVDLFKHLKVIVTYTFLIAMLLYVPFSNTSWAYAINQNNINQISWDTADHLIEDNNAVLFDARSNYKYLAKHVPGAKSLPTLEFDKYFKEYDDLAKDKIIILYCDAENCSLATRGAFKLIARGYTQIFTVTGGIETWIPKADSKK